MSKILVVDDERNVLSGFEEVLRPEGHEVTTSRSARAALAYIEDNNFDLAILDIRMPGMSGLDALDQIKQAHPKLPVIIMTGVGTMETAVEATKRGAFDYHVKPFEPADMLRTIEKALECARLMKNQVTLGRKDTAVTGDAIIGQSAPMQEVYKAIGRVAQTDATVLIRGESGTGKELVARAIYHHSLRCDAPLSVVNCVAIPETLLESELFGYEKGAFTGAAARRVGKFEQANGGTVFLDEIGDMPLGIQAKILRVLQEKEFERLGGNQTIHVDVRVLTATNRDLEIAIAEGAFREDLYYRLDVVTIQVPPLRDRREDIPALVDYFLDRSARELNVDRPPLADEAVELLQNQSWPGNVRELQHCIQRALIQTRGRSLQAADLHLNLEVASGRAEADVANQDDQQLLDIVQRWLNSHGGLHASERLLERVEKLLVAEALSRTHGNQTRAAELLGLPRPTFHAKMNKHGVRAKADPQQP